MMHSTTPLRHSKPKYTQIVLNKYTSYTYTSQRCAAGMYVEFSDEIEIDRIVGRASTYRNQ